MPAGPGRRVDTATEAGDRIPPEYDNLLAKVMVHAADREAAIDRLARALAETEIAGIQTTLPFHRFVAGHDGFRGADLSIGWVAEHWDGPAQAERAQRLARLAAALAWTGRTVPAGVLAQRQDAAVTGPVTGADAASQGWSETALQAGVDRWPE
jgi:acetyl/propionyl-CoA carboxylase alpha subunit